jgi:AraC-like DNA-binding protein
MHPILTVSPAVVLYDLDVADEIPNGAACRINAWRPPGVEEISEVFHARIVDYGYPSHCHDTWTVLIVDTGAISYDLDRRRCGALGETVAILPPGVTHNGKPAPGAKGFAKRVLYLDQSVLPIGLVGAAVDRTNIEDPQLRRSLAALHDELVIGADPFAASSALALISERITQRLAARPGSVASVDVASVDVASAEVAGVEKGVAHQLRLILDEPIAEHVTLDAAARRLGRSKAHLIRTFTARYGIAPHAYLIGKRIEMARTLLLDGVPSADVAAVVGFYDQSHFNRHFKRHTSVPPAAYAASRRGK